MSLWDKNLVGYRLTRWIAWRRADDSAVAAFDRAATSLRVPLKIVRDSLADGRKAYEACLMLVRADRYVVWVSNQAPADTERVMAKVVGR